MSLVQIYQCLCDETRLRILNLLQDGELCVCHFQEILGEPQVKISKHLAYLRARGLVEARREANWMIYSLPANQSKALSANLACLQDCASENQTFLRDTQARQKIKNKIFSESPVCCPPSSKKKIAKSCCQ